MGSNKHAKLPSGWEMKTLGEIGKIRMCKRIFNHETSENGEIPFFKIGTFGKEPDAFISKELYENYRNRFSFPKIGDILISAAGTLGRTVVYNGKPAYFQDSNIVWIDNYENLVTNNYLVYVYQVIKYDSEGGTIQRLYNNIISNAKFICPPLPEQKAIANILSTWDKAIQSTQALISKKEEEKKWLMQNLLTGKKRLKGFSGEWRKKGAGEVFASFTKKGFENEELLSATQDRGIIPRSMLEGRVTMPDGSTSGYKLVEPGDFIISLRSFQGGLEYSHYRGIVSPAYTVLKPKSPINDEFYKQYFKSHEFIGRLSIAVIGIRDGKQISYDDFCTVKIPNPSNDEQTAIASVLQTADREIEILQHKLEQQKLQKKGLMQVLLTGKVRVKI